jgi:hypothetical protein
VLKFKDCIRLSSFSDQWKALSRADDLFDIKTILQPHPEHNFVHLLSNSFLNIDHSFPPLVLEEFLFCIDPIILTMRLLTQLIATLAVGTVLGVMAAPAPLKPIDEVGDLQYVRSIQH